jgi:hypothetical protein
MDIALDLIIPKPAPEPTPQGATAKASPDLRVDPLAIPRWGTGGRYVIPAAVPARPRQLRAAAVAAPTILPVLPEKTSRWR